MVNYEEEKKSDNNSYAFSNDQINLVNQSGIGIGLRSTDIHKPALSAQHNDFDLEMGRQGS